ncbi:MAG TPA: MarR family winged helix-turn-helix transcriptional regulator [Gaiellaceae bacterium]|nr:MarR family winged helix-turn-helix transcriptional regulator [Gaiellaceae bacterium]
MTTQAAAPTAVRAWARLLRAHAATTRLLSAQLQAEHGLTLNDYEALLVLSRTQAGHMKRVDLARTLLLTPSGVTRLLDGLERAGFVESVPCPTDRRVMYAKITAEGRAKLADASCGHEGSIRTALEAHLSKQELDTIAEILGKLPGVAEGDDSCRPA